MNYRLVFETPYRIVIRKTTDGVGRDIFPTLPIARAYLAERYDALIDQLRDAKKAATKTPEKALANDEPASVPAEQQPAAQEEPAAEARPIPSAAGDVHEAVAAVAMAVADGDADLLVVDRRGMKPR